MICKHCGTEIADRALICYRCGHATTEPRIAPPPATRARPPGRSVLPSVVLLLTLVATVVSMPYAEAYGVPKVVPWTIVVAGALALVWTLVRRPR